MEGDEDLPSLKLSRYSRKKTFKRPAVTKVKPKKQPKRRRKTSGVPIPSFSPVDHFKDFDTSILDTPLLEKKKKLELDTSILDTPPKKPEPIVWNVDDDDYDDDELPPPVFGTSQNIKVPEKKSPVRKVSIESAKQSAELPLELVRTIDKPMKDGDTSKIALPDIDDIKSRLEIDDPSVAKDPSKKEVVSRKEKETVARDPAAAKEVVSRKAKETINPKKDELLLSVDCLFVQAELESVTMKDFIMSLEAEYGAKLHKDSRAMVKAHLKVLVSGDVEPRVSLPTITDLQHVAMEKAPLKDTSYAHTTKKAVSIEEESTDDNMVFNIDQVDESEVPCGKAKAPQAKPEKQPIQLPEPANPKTQKRDRPRKDVNIDQISVERPSKCSATSGNSRKPPAKTSKAPARPRAKKGTCALCTTCICTIGKDAYTEQTPGGMSRTDAEIERALIRRVMKLEDITDKYENALDRVNRELKKHRRDVWKKQEACVNGGKQLAFGNSRFLPDADIWDEQAQAVQQEALPRSVVYEAQRAVFGGYHQPTLTQMFGGGSKKDDENAGEHIDSTDALVDAENDTAVFDLCSPAVIDEDNEDALEVTEAVEEYADCDPETSPVDRIHRLTWREGAKAEAQSPLLRGSGVWSALTTKSFTTSTNASDCLSSFQPDSIAKSPRRSSGLLRSTSNDDKYICAWDALFSDHVASDDGGMTQLLDLFEAEMMDGDVVSAEMPTKELASSQTSLIDTPMLTQRGQSLVEAIEDRITSDPIRLQAVEAVCPNWRDSIRYALAQHGEDEVREALERVQHSIENLNRMKEMIPALLKRQELVLQLFEMSLTESLTRLETSVGSHNNCIDDSQAVSNAALVCLRPDDGTLALAPISEGDERVDNDLVGFA